MLVQALISQDSLELSGVVTDENGMEISVGDVVLYANGGETLISYSSIYNGAFILEALPGNYILTISCLGYATYKRELVLDANAHLTIGLKEEATALEGVAVLAAKNPITYSNGNYKVDLTNPVFSAIPEVLDVLAKLPNVQVAPDRESISVLGKGNPLLYSGSQQLTFEEFIAIPPNAIASIELINNPSAKYEAEGRAVFLITRKVSFEDSAQLHLSETASVKRNFNNYLGANWSYAKNKLILQGNLAYNVLKPWESNGFEFEIPQRGVRVDYTVLIPQNNRVQSIAGVGLRYQINATDYVSVNGTIKRRTDNFLLETNTLLEDGDSQDAILTNAENNNSKDFISASANFNTKLDSTITLFTGLQYSYFLQQLDTQISNSRNALDFVLDEARGQQYQLNSVAARIDLEKEYNSSAKWEGGLNWNRAGANASSNSENLQFLRTTSSTFDYKEIVFAAYTSLTTKLDEKKELNLGLRLEHNAVEAELAGTETPVINRENTNFFPRVGITIAVDSVKSLSLNYAKSILRPDFSRTNSISVFINPFLEGTGNVNLRPSTTNEISINYQRKKQSFFFNLFQTRNPINFTIGFDSNLDTAVLSQVNLEREEGISTGWTVPITKGVWTANNTANLVLNKILDSSVASGTAVPYFYFYTDHQFKIANKTTLSFGGWAVTERKEGIFQRNGLVVLNAAIATTLFKKWDCALRFNDITRAMNFEETYSVNGVNANGTYFADGRELAFSIKYRFGSTKKVSFKNEDVDENLDRID